MPVGAVELDAPAWWPDWWDRPCAIVASGPSAKGAGVQKLRGRLQVIAIKENAVELCPWADVAYGCDLAWWRHRRGLPDFKGLKIGWDPAIPQYCPDVKTITIKAISQRPVQYAKDLQFDAFGVIGGGGNSGFQAINLAAQFGSNRILLIGFDCHDRSGAHWYGRNNWMRGNNPDSSNFRTWLESFEVSGPVLRRKGIDVVNASPRSVIRCFRKMSVDQVLAEWGL